MIRPVQGSLLPLNHSISLLNVRLVHQVLLHILTTDLLQNTQPVHFQLITLLLSPIVILPHNVFFVVLLASFFMLLLVRRPLKLPDSQCVLRHTRVFGTECLHICWLNVRKVIFMWVFLFWIFRGYRLRVVMICRLVFTYGLCLMIFQPFYNLLILFWFPLYLLSAILSPQYLILLTDILFRLQTSHFGLSFLKLLNMDTRIPQQRDRFGDLSLITIQGVKFTFTFESSL